MIVRLLKFKIKSKQNVNHRPQLKLFTQCSEATQFDENAKKKKLFFSAHSDAKNNNKTRKFEHIDLAYVDRSTVYVTVFIKIFIFG